MLSMLSELSGAASAFGALWATRSLAIQGGAITNDTTVSIGLLVVAGGTLVAFAWRAGRKTASIEAKIDLVNARLDHMETLNEHHDQKLDAIHKRITDHLVDG